MLQKRILIYFSVFFISLLNANNLYSQQYKVKKIVIDAGHGGHDPGAVGKNAKEKDLTLQLSLKIGKYLEDNLKDVEVIYTRKTDVFLPLWKRTKIANDAKADLFVSIHCNAVGTTRAKGTETFVLGMHRSEDNLKTAQKENASILLESDYEENYNNFNPNSDESYILFSLIQSEYRDQSIDVASKVQSEFKNRVKRIDRGVKEAGYLVLVSATMPAILIEAGFVSNPDEEKFLMSEHGQDYLASAIFRAIRDYKEEMESGLSIEEALEEVQVDSNLVVDAESAEDREQIEKVNIVFGIQFATSSQKKPVNSKSFRDTPDVWSYQQNGLYKYVSGKYTTLKEASDNLNAIREKGFSDAFVVAFIDGERVSPQEAMKKVSKKSN
jgi:N-acetylmuramoyl-L-alanine amidase